MTKLGNYNNDGANYQAQAVLAYLQRGDFLIEESWNAELGAYAAQPTVSRWENCREQGYVICLRKGVEQINIAFFEHRNSDEIHAVKWQQVTVNAPTIETAKFGDVYKDKYDTSFKVEYGEVIKMVDWIQNELIEFWGDSK